MAEVTEEMGQIRIQNPVLIELTLSDGLLVSPSLSPRKRNTWCGLRLHKNEGLKEYTRCTVTGSVLKSITFSWL